MKILAKDQPTASVQIASIRKERELKGLQIGGNVGRNMHIQVLLSNTPITKREMCLNTKCEHLSTMARDHFRCKVFRRATPWPAQSRKETRTLRSEQRASLLGTRGRY